jgi:hypothetical protein
MVSFNIATIPSRKKELINTIDSIYNQVDVIRIALNGYSEKPKELDKYSDKLSYSITDNSLGDAFKFLWVEKSNGYYLTGDDDLIYPPNYAEEMIKEIDSHGIVTHHGRSFDSFPIANYYKGATKRVQCLSENLNYGTIQFGGTGVMGFHTDYFKPKFDIFKRANMADIWIGIEAHKQGKKITTLPHSKDYFRYQHVEHTIWHDKNPRS